MLEKLYNAIRSDANAKIISLGDRTFTDKNILPVFASRPPILELKTLSGLVDYLKTNVDGLAVDSLLCVVNSPQNVALFSNLYGAEQQRAIYVNVKCTPPTFQTDAFLDAEKFNVMLQSVCVDPDDPKLVTDKARVLAYISNIKALAESGATDDGVTQTVTVKAGIASVKNAPLPNPVVLRPYRTFTEVEQPASQFVFRAKANGDEGITYKLTEADGGAWRSEAMKNVQEYLRQNVKGLQVIA